MTQTITPGLKRLRASPAAEAIRAMTIADQERARREALARIEAAKADAAEAIDLPAAFVLGRVPDIEGDPKVGSGAIPLLPS
jgi:hypothetical protein